MSARSGRRPPPPALPGPYGSRRTEHGHPPARTRPLAAAGVPATTARNERTTRPARAPETHPAATPDHDGTERTHDPTGEGPRDAPASDRAPWRSPAERPTPYEQERLDPTCRTN
ncbi:hypothetical protein GCM10010358_10270 [Streptomyces minutiscleroticus]|uniref:Uncharacterized protein n=1 Tax=Streptomyces minutiscleroticus TaxID=68238 RepID=A0A918KBS6_9ACTN|nr:hypothetical protein GCM10010358_10270 [Streptomyces minutiscleroticus]